MSEYSTPRDGYEWTCPFCGDSRVNATSDDSGKANAIAALRTHVVASDDAEHGPKNHFPEAYAGLTLADHVVRVGEAATAVESQD